MIDEEQYLFRLQPWKWTLLHHVKDNGLILHRFSHHQPLAQGLYLAGSQDEGIAATERPWNTGVTGMVITALFSLPTDEFECCD